MVTRQNQHRLRLAILGDGSSPHLQRPAAWLAARGHEVHILSEDGLGPFPEMQGIRFHTYPSHRRFPGKVAAIRRILKQLRPDVLHSHFINHGGTRGVATGFHPHVLSVWGSDLLVETRNPRKKLQAVLTLRAVDRVLPVSKDLAYEAERLAHIRNLNVVHWGVDTHRFSPENSDFFQVRFGKEAGPIVYSPRALAPLYNQDVLVEAWPQVLKRYPNAVLVLKEYLTDQAFRAKLIKRLSELNLAQSVRFLGELSDDEFVAAYRAADLVISIPDSDGTPNTVLEAMACAKPLIVCDVPSLREWIEEGLGGYRVDPNSSEALSQAMLRFFALSVSAKGAMGRQNREKILQTADRESRLAELEQILIKAAVQTSGFSLSKTIRNILGFA